MKKLLTTAALLTIGTAASFATEFTLTGDVGDSVTSGRAAITSITLDNGDVLDSGAILDGSKYDWSISFSISGFNLVTSTGGDSLTNQETLFSVDRSGGVGTGYGVIAYADGSTVYYTLTSNAEAHTGQDSYGNDLVILGTSSASYAGATLTISWNSVASTLSLDVEGATGVSAVIEDGSVSLITAASATENSNSATTFWTNNANNPIYGITLSVTETPEPSMFGLFAGLGAIGLVAARRRRNRKA